MYKQNNMIKFILRKVKARDRSLTIECSQRHVSKFYRKCRTELLECLALNDLENTIESVDIITTFEARCIYNKTSYSKKFITNVKNRILEAKQEGKRECLYQNLLRR